MLRSGSMTLSDLAASRLLVACKRCGRTGSYASPRSMPSAAISGCFLSELTSTFRTRVRSAGMSGKSVDASLKAAEAEIALRERLMKEASDLIARTGADDASFFWFERRERLELVRA
jgi:hypothetical protein